MAKTFTNLTKNPQAMKAVFSELFPEQGPQKEFYVERLNNKDDLDGHSITVLDCCMAEYELSVFQVAAGRRESPMHQYLPIFQSINWGKSKMVAAKNVSPENFDFGLRTKGSRRAPERTPEMADAIEGASSVADYLFILDGCLEALLAHLPKSQRSGSARAIFPGKTPPAFWKAALQKVAEVRAARRDEKSLVARCQLHASDALGRGLKRILFSFDEAAGLCKGDTGSPLRFKYLVAALAAFPKGVFGLFLDTNSPVGAFLFSDDPVERRRIFAPYICFPGTGVIAMPRMLQGAATRAPPPNGSLSGGGLSKSPFERAFSARPGAAAFVKGLLRSMATVDNEEMLAKFFDFCQQLLNLGPDTEGDEGAKWPF